MLKDLILLIITESFKFNKTHTKLENGQYTLLFLYPNYKNYKKITRITRKLLTTSNLFVNLGNILNVFISCNPETI